ncbi:MAG: biopolymer transporter ExbD [Myxococcota bacterium]
MANGQSRRGGGSGGGLKKGTGTHNYSFDDLSYVRRKRGRVDVETGGDEDGELNIVPYLDIMMNLIIFMLVAKAASVSLGMIDVTAPSYAALGGPGGGPKQEKDEKRLDRLTVGIARNGFYVAAVGGVLPGQEAETATTEVTKDGVARTAPTVPLLRDGAYDFATLAKKMRGIKNAFPSTQAVYIAADNDIPYEVLVATLDATREDTQGLLFPAVAFTQIN